MDLRYITELFDESRRVWKETEIEERKVIARLLLRAGFEQVHIARWLGVHISSIHNWKKKGEIT